MFSFEPAKRVMCLAVPSTRQDEATAFFSLKKRLIEKTIPRKNWII